LFLLVAGNGNVETGAWLVVLVLDDIHFLRKTSDGS